MSKIVGYQNGKTRSAFIELQPEETEYQKAVREYNEKQTREQQEAIADAEKQHAEQVKDSTLVYPKESKPFSVGDAARMILDATEDMDPKARGIFIELLAKGEV